MCPFRHGGRVPSRTRIGKMVAPVTSTIRGVPSEVMVGIERGLKHTSAVNLDHVQTVDCSRLEKYLGHLGEKTMGEICRALSIATGCED